jgi:hypothetical protein
MADKSGSNPGGSKGQLEIGKAVTTGRSICADRVSTKAAGWSSLDEQEKRWRQSVSVYQEGVAKYRHSTVSRPYLCLPPAGRTPGWLAF